MRDPNRIPEVLEALRKTWEANPDLRLGQLVTNAADAHSPGGNYTAFYIEDAEMLEGLKKLTPEPKPVHVHSFWTVQWWEEGLLQECKDESCKERRMVKYR